MPNSPREIIPHKTKTRVPIIPQRFWYLAGIRVQGIDRDTDTHIHRHIHIDTQIDKHRHTEQTRL